MKNQMHITRRSFLNTVGGVVAGMIVVPQFIPSRLLGQESPSNKLNLACIGLGGQMHGLMKDNQANLHANVLAICDLDAKRMEVTRSMPELGATNAKQYKDYRELLRRESSVDGVLIASPDHWHAILSTAAIKAGKHVYCEKPLTHTVGDARAMRLLAKQSKVVTQTGNQGSASDNFRRSMELIQAGVLGTVREIYIWHPPHGWPNGVDRPVGEDPIPEGFDWDYWLGPSPARPYKNGIYHPGAWRGWFDFGGGSLADFCCHAFSLPVRALNLDYPEKIEVAGDWLGKESFPITCRVRFNFPARGGREAVSLFFSTGKDGLPPGGALVGLKETFGSIPTSGCLLIGEKGTLSAGLWNSECYVKMKGESKFVGGDNHEAIKPIPKTLPRVQGLHLKEWMDACKGGNPTFSPFEIGGHVTEIGSAGLIALRLGQNIEWDGMAMQIKGNPDSKSLADPAPRKGAEKYWNPLQV